MIGGAPRPRFEPVEAQRLAAELFGWTGAATDLGGERDQTFAIRSDHGRAVLKIANQDETRADLDLELAILRHVEAVDPDLPVPRRLPLAGAPDDGTVGVARREGSEHLVRMLTHLDGRVVAPGPALGDDGVRRLGEVAGRLDRALSGLFHPAAGRALEWDVGRVGEARRWLDAIPDAGRRALVARAIDRFAADALPRWRALRAQVVHGDLHLDNVLFAGDGAVSGVIDFGDAVHGPVLVDVASALASLLRGREADQMFRVARLFVDGYAARSPLERRERELLGVTLAARLAGVVALASRQVRADPDNAPRFAALIEESAAVLERLDAMAPEAVDRALGAPDRRPTEILRADRRRLFGPVLADLFYDEPVHVAGGEGAWLVDADGRRLLDAYNNVAVVGHGHPRVVAAVVDQTRRITTHTRYLYEPLMELAERLTEGVAERHGLDTVMILNSGSEANDLAWRLATSATGQRGGLVSDYAYHGMTVALSDLSPQQWPAGYRAEHVERFAVEDGATDPHAMAAGVEAAIGRLAERDVRPAAMFVEGGFTSEGVITPAAADVVAAVAGARAAGALIVADEVQIGHGRTGSHLWSFDRYGYSPDVVTMGKPMGDGYPVAALLTRADVVERFRGGQYYFSTFGGNPVAARAALAVLDVIDDERLLERVATVGETLAALLATSRTRSALIRDVRHHGTLFGVQLSGADVAKRAVDGLRRRGVLVGRTGRADDVVKIRPPLVFGEPEARLLVTALDAVLAELAAHGA